MMNGCLGSLSLRRSLGLGGLALLALGCAATNSPESGWSPDQSSGGSSGGRDNGGMGSGGAGARDPGPMTPPQEREDERDFEAPQAGARFVFVANTARDSVAIIDSTNLTIRTVDVGDAPMRLATVPGQDVALVINVGTRDLSVIRATAAGATVATLPIVAGTNRVSVAPDGRHALVWFDPTRDGGGLTSGSFQDLTLVRIDTAGGDRAWPLTVGFKPSQVSFARDGAAAYVVTEDGVSVVRFASIIGPARVPLVPLGLAPDEAARDVSVTPDGRFVVARAEGATGLALVDLETRVVSRLDLGAPVTDLDLGPQGDFALAVLGGESRAVRIALPGGFTSAEARTQLDLTGFTIGASVITPDGARAVFYTTAQPVGRMVVAALDGSTSRLTVDVRKAVRSVTIAPDGASAVVIHRKADGSPGAAGLSAEERFARLQGYSVASLTDGFAKWQETAADPGAMAITPDSDKVFILLRADGMGLRMAQRVDLTTFLVDDFPLASPPVTVAALAGSRKVFISQEHPSGRISFIDWETGGVASVTGFELNGRIVQ